MYTMKTVSFLVVVFAAFACASCSSSYGAPAASSVPAPPCPKNYLFSCQPNLVPAPCAQQAPAAYGSAGAYTEQVPSYIGFAPYQQMQQYHQRIGNAALIDELRSLGQGIQGQQY
ncbi:vitelline membrane protein Vm32E [Drosophila guanche]|uniref:Blast:Vitelline membrane protein Vm32E n=2 Tax=Drosophila guanche TaxID=7266 RepID=A0A3B0K7J1_DROGU|nr:vitelline membrane protein Vm32E [Drosophila guanche]SPP79488.1 blast:Vitelline membrane protein Vm32E [Drosophila guanche]